MRIWTGPSGNGVRICWRHSTLIWTSRHSDRVSVEQALASNLKAYGEARPEVSAGGFGQPCKAGPSARVLEKLGDLRAASVLCAKALASDLMTHHEYHPKVRRNRATLTRLLRKLGVNDQEPEEDTYTIDDRRPVRWDDAILIERALALASTPVKA